MVMMMFCLGAKRNQLVDAPALNERTPRVLERPGPPDAGRDGYTCLSTADRSSGRRQPIGVTPVYAGPRFTED